MVRRCTKTLLAVWRQVAGGLTGISCLRRSDDQFWNPAPGYREVDGHKGVDSEGGSRAEEGDRDGEEVDQAPE